MRAVYRSWLIGWLFLLVFSFAAADGRYSISAAKEYRVRYLVEVTNRGGAARDLNLRIPIFMTDGLPPYQKVKSFRAPAGVIISKDKNGQTAEYRLSRLDKGESLSLEFSFTFVNYAINYQLKPYRGSSQVESSYLQPEPGIESDNVQIKQLAGKLTSEYGTQLEKAKRIFYYVNSTLEYQKIERDTRSALETLKIGKGVCEDFSLVFIALCRASGIPARLVRGYRFNDSDLKSGETDLRDFAHAWAEVYLPAEGWVTVEPTFTYRYNGVKTVSYEFFGKIDKTDRHLFYSYEREIAPSCSWTHDPRNPADLKLSFRALLR